MKTMSEITLQSAIAGAVVTSPPSAKRNGGRKSKKKKVRMMDRIRTDSKEPHQISVLCLHLPMRLVRGIPPALP